MELNREQIIKALGYCKSPKLTKCDGCPREQEDGHCMYRLNADALALIKELTEKEKKSDRVFSDLYKEAETYLAQRECLRNQVKNLTDENERLRAEKEAENKELFYKWKKLADETADRYEGLYQDAKKALAADIVWKMHHKIWLEFSDCYEEETVSIGSLRASVDQIAKEMLEGRDEVQDT